MIILKKTFFLFGFLPIFRIRAILEHKKKPEYIKGVPEEREQDFTVDPRMLGL